MLAKELMIPFLSKELVLDLEINIPKLGKLSGSVLLTSPFFVLLSSCWIGSNPCYVSVIWRQELNWMSLSPEFFRLLVAFDF